MSETEHDRKQRFAATSACLYHSLLAGADPCNAANEPLFDQLAGGAAVVLSHDLQKAKVCAASPLRGLEVFNDQAS